MSSKFRSLRFGGGRSKYRKEKTKPFRGWKKVEELCNDLSCDGIVPAVVLNQAVGI